MRIAAYLLAADPTWIERSVTAYYDRVEEILVTYDEAGIGWAGSPIATEECLSRLRRIDVAGKLRFLGEDFHSCSSPPDGERHQRQVALDALAGRCDWVLQIDTDEVLPDVDRLIAALHHADDRELDAVEWPMRVLFRQVGDLEYLVVTGENGRGHFEYPGPIAIRPTTTLVEARRADVAFLRPVVAGDSSSLQLSREPSGGEDRSFTIDDAQAILHNSWARSPAVVRRKVRAWGHNAGWRTWRYYVLTWLPSPYLWRWQRDLHPFSEGLWPRLAKLEID